MSFKIRLAHEKRRLEELQDMPTNRLIDLGKAAEVESVRAAHDSILRDLIRADCHEKIRLYVDAFGKKIDINRCSPDDHDRTLLALACEMDESRGRFLDIEVVRALLDCAADPNVASLYYDCDGASSDERYKNETVIEGLERQRGWHVSNAENAREQALREGRPTTGMWGVPSMQEYYAGFVNQIDTTITLIKSYAPDPRTEFKPRLVAEHPDVSS